MFANFVVRASLACLLCLGMVFAGCNEESADGSGGSSSSAHGGSTAATGPVPNTPPNDNTDALNVLTGGVSSSGGVGGPMLNKPDNTEAEEEGSATEEPEGSDSKDDSDVGHDEDSDHDESGHEDDDDAGHDD